MPADTEPSLIQEVQYLNSYLLHSSSIKALCSFTAWYQSYKTPVNCTVSVIKRKTDEVLGGQQWKNDEKSLLL